MSEINLVNRRRALVLASAVAVAWGSRFTGPVASEAREKDRTRKKDAGKKKARDKKDRKHNNKKQDENNGGNSSGNGDKVVSEAKRCKGAKYKWGGASPKGFDCSGFTWYVYDKAVNMDIGRTVKDQYKKGKSVSNGSWKAGDIVFFKNTFEHGLSHNGIYISGGKFIHSENEDTGVVISTLDSGYYKDHYAGARRML